MKHTCNYRNILRLSAVVSAIFLLGLIMLKPVQAQKAENPEFEGIIEYDIPSDISSGSANQSLTYMASGNHGRIEFVMETGRKIAVLVDSKQQHITMLMDQAQAYMEFPLNKVEESGSQSNGDQPTLQKTGQTDRIAGRSCSIWRVEEEEHTIDMCVANDMGNFLLPGTNIPSSMGPLQVERRPEWFQEAMQRGFMPLKIDVTENGNTRTVLQARSIQEKTLSSSLFTVPSGYQNMNQMMRQMMQGEDGN